MRQYNEKRVHSRINITPASTQVDKCFTIANLCMWRYNWQMALSAGGTNIIQLEDVLAQNESISYRSDRKPIAESIIAQASHYGIAASSVELLESLGVEGKYQVMYQSDSTEITNAIWKHLLPYIDYFPEPWKTWPPVFPNRAHGCSSTLNMAGVSNGLPGFRGLPTMLIASRVIEDMISGRNLFVNGAECQHSKGTYNDICSLLRIPPPLQLTAPLLRRRRENGQVDVIRTSVYNDNPYHVTVAMKAGVTYEELWRFLQKIVLVPKKSWTEVTRCEPQQWEKALNPFPVIDDAEWTDLLETARARKAGQAIAALRTAEKEVQQKAAVAEKEAKQEAGQEKQRLAEIEERIESRAKDLAEVIVAAEVKRLECNRKRRESRAREKAEKCSS